MCIFAKVCPFKDINIYLLKAGNLTLGEYARIAALNKEGE